MAARRQGEGLDVARYRITCVGHCASTAAHRHATSIGIGRHSASPGVKWSIEAVRDAMESGHSFYVVGDRGTEVDVAPMDCACGAETIALEGDSATDHATVRLPTCGWAERLADATTGGRSV